MRSNPSLDLKHSLPSTRSKPIPPIQPMHQKKIDVVDISKLSTDASARSETDTSADLTVKLKSKSNSYIIFSLIFA